MASAADVVNRVLREHGISPTATVATDIFPALRAEGYTVLWENLADPRARNTRPAGGGSPQSLRLVSVYDRQDAPKVLFELLGERDPQINISHVKMPTWETHCAFVASRPYREWHVIEVNSEAVGACYLSKQNEIGIFIFARHQRQGYGHAAVRMILAAHRGERLLANIAPRNERSHTFFERLGFRHIQDTLAIQQHEMHHP